jgi:hypothetical protein
MEDFLSKDYVGTNTDSYHYLKNAYSIYLTLKPYDSFRWLSGYLFALFIFIFGKYCILAIIIFQAISFSIALSILLLAIKTDFKIKLFIILWTFLIGFYTIPRILLETPTMVLILLALTFYHKNRFSAFSFFLFLASSLRFEFTLILIISSVIIFMREKRIFVLPLFLSFLSIVIFFYLHALKPSDYKGFYGGWLIGTFYRNVKGYWSEELKGRIFQQCENKGYECFIEHLFSEISKNKTKTFEVVIKNLFLNPLRATIFRTPVFDFESSYMKALFIVFYIISTLANFLVAVFVIISIVKFWNIHKAIIISYFLLIIIETFYYIFGDFVLRATLYNLPFEIYLILVKFSNKNNIYYN